eukprot:4757667-Amphidinium_carterae.1
MSNTFEGKQCRESFVSIHRLAINGDGIEHASCRTALCVVSVSDTVCCHRNVCPQRHGVAVLVHLRRQVLRTQSLEPKVALVGSIVTSDNTCVVMSDRWRPEGTANGKKKLIQIIAEDCQKREAHQRKIVDAVHLIPKGYKADGWKGVHQRLQRVIQLTSLAGSSEKPLYVETMYKILEHGMSNASPQRSEELEQLREFRSRIYEM